MDQTQNQTLLSQRPHLRTRRPLGAKPLSPFPRAAPSLFLKISSIDLSCKPASSAYSSRLLHPAQPPAQLYITISKLP